MADDNLPRWDGVRRGHYEVWYLTLNHRASRTGFWICYTVDAPVAGAGAPFGQVWFTLFDATDPGAGFGIRRTFPIDAVRLSEAPFGVVVGEAELAAGLARGDIAGDCHAARWSLAWAPSALGHRHLPPVLYWRDGLVETTVAGPNVDVGMSGVIEVDGREFRLDGERGNQSHLWGRAHVHRWAWGHCNSFDGARDATLESLTVRLRRRGRTLPPVTVLTLYLDGQVFRWNRFLHVPLTRGRVPHTTRYEVRARRPDVDVRGTFECRPADMIATEYFDPQGRAPSWCHNTEVARLELRVRRRGWLGRWRDDCLLGSGSGGHFEVGGPRRDPAIVRELRTVG